MTSLKSVSKTEETQMSIIEKFVDIYRIYAKNCTIDLFEESWGEKDYAFLKEKLDKVKPLIENGDLIIDILKRELDEGYDCPPFSIALEHVAVVLFEIERRVNGSSKSDFFAAQDQESIVEVDKEVEKEDFKPDDTWTEEEDEIITKYYPNMTAPAIKLEKLPRRSEQAIYDRAYFLKIQKQKHRENEPKTETTKKERWGEWSGLFPKDQILAKYNIVYIYKPIVDEIMKDLSDEFTKKDLGIFLYNYFNDVLKREISEASSNVYKGKYLKYLVDNDLIKEERTRDGIKFVKIKKEKPIDEKPVIAIKEPSVEKPIITIERVDDVAEKPVHADEEMQQPVRFADGKTLDESIYNYAMGCGFKTSILVLTIKRRFPEYTSDEIEIALAKIIQDGKAYQSAPERIKFFGVDQ